MKIKFRCTGSILRSRLLNGKYRLLQAATMLLAFLSLSCGSKQESLAGDPPPPPDVSRTVSVAVDRSQQKQTIDGFGFFGAMAVWWDGNAANLYHDLWARKVIEDLGITIWRNEYYPPSTAAVRQNADWAKQKPVVEGLNRIAKENRVPLKYIFTVWSPPADMKCALDANDRPLSGTPHPQGTLNGGTLDPAKYTEFANWLKAGLQLYKDVGIDVYAFSAQNEPLFKQPTFNSCYYKPINEPVGGFTNMMRQVIPQVKAAFPNVKVFGSEHMLRMEGGKDRQWFYHANLMKDAQAMQQIDILAVHGYNEGVTPTASSELATLWKTTVNEYMVPTGKPFWMTETSGYFDTWQGKDGKPGAFSLAQDIFSALHHGNASAWVWWQGSDVRGIDEYALMTGTGTGKKYAVSKHYYRFIRPGAKRLSVNFNEAEGVFVTAFEHAAMGAITLVLVNTNKEAVKLNLTGAGLPSSYEMYLTTEGTDNCRLTGTVNNNAVILPAQSVVTLVNGKYRE